MNHNAWIQRAQTLSKQREPFALVSVLHAVAPTSAQSGDKAIVTADGKIYGWIGGGCAQPAVLKTVRLALRDGQARQIRIGHPPENVESSLSDVLEFGMPCHSQGALTLFIDPILPAARLLIIGDSPVAHALCRLASQLDFDITILAQNAQIQDFTCAQQVLNDDAPDTVSALWRAGGWVVVATQGRRDLQGLRVALAVQARCVWFVASARKAKVLKQQLLTEHTDSQAVHAVVAPAGERTGAKTTEEIALAVLSAVVAARRGQPAIVGEDAPLATAATHTKT